MFRKMVVDNVYFIFSSVLNTRYIDFLTILERVTKALINIVGLKSFLKIFAK